MSNWMTNGFTGYAGQGDRMFPVVEQLARINSVRRSFNLDPVRAGAGQGDNISGRTPKRRPILASILTAIELILDSGPSNPLGIKGDVEGVDIALGLGEASKRLGPSAARVVR